MANNQIKFGVGFNVDESSLSKLKASLKQVQNLTTFDISKNLKGEDAEKALSSIKASAKEVEQALEKAFNVGLGTTNVTKFNAELKKLDLNKIYQDLTKAGAAGQAAFRGIATQALTTNTALKQTSNILDKMGETFINSIKWNIASSAINGVSNSVQKAYSYVNKLDDSLNAIRIVTGSSAEEMDRFAEHANKAAGALGQQTTAYTKAALTFYQQGLGDEEVQARTEASLKAANVTGASAADTANQLTAVWNGYKVAAEDTVSVVDKLAAVADSSASDLSELAVAMSKVASTANNMGVDIDQLNAQLATVIATTRQAPESVGNAFKTIYSRINDIKTGADDAEISLGNYSGRLASVGINVLDMNGRLRDTGEVFDEIGSKWDSFSREQQLYITNTMAGQRQLNNVLALFDNWDIYNKQLNVSLESQGALEQKNSVYLESLTAHTRQFKDAQEALIQTFTDSDSFKNAIDLGTNGLKLLNDLTKAIGGGGPVLLAFGGILARTFSKSIAQNITPIVENIRNLRSNAEQLSASKEAVNEFMRVLEQNEGLDKTTKAIIELKKQIVELSDVLSPEENARLNAYLQDLEKIAQKKDELNVRRANVGSRIADLNASEIGFDDNYWKQLEQEADELRKKTGTNKIFNANDLEDSSAAFKKLSTVLKDLDASYDKAESGAKEFKKALAAIKKTLSAGVITDKDTQKVKNFEKALENLKLQAFNLDLDEGISAQTRSQITYLENELKQAEAAAKESGEGISREMVSAAQRLSDAIRKGCQEGKQNIKEMEETAVEVTNNTASQMESRVEGASNKIKASLQKAFDTKNIRGLANLGSSLMALASSGSMVYETFRKTNGESKSLGQAFSSLATAAIGAGFAFAQIKELGNSFPAVKEKIRSVIETTIKLPSAFKTAIPAAEGAEGALEGVGKAAVVTKVNLSACLGVLMAFGVVLEIGFALWNNYKEGLENARKAAEAEAEQAKESKEIHDELYDTYVKALKVYEETGEGKAGLLKATQDVAEAYGIEKDAYEKLLQVYGGKIPVTEFAEKRAEESRQLAEKYKTAADEERAKLKRDGGRSVGVSAGFDTDYSRRSEYANNPEKKEKAAKNREIWDAIKTEAEEAGIASSGGSAKYLTAVEGQQKELYDLIQKKVKEYGTENNTIIAELQKDYLDKYSETIKEVIKNEKGIYEASADAAANKTLEDAKTDNLSISEVSKLKDQMKETFKKDEGELFDEATPEQLEIVDKQINKVIGSIGNYGKALDEIESRDKLEDLLKAGGAEDTTDLLNEGLDSGVYSKMIDDLQGVAQMSKGLFQRSYTKALQEAAEEARGTTNDIFNDASKVLAETGGTEKFAKKISENKEKQEEFNKALAETKGLYDETKTAADEWADLEERGAGAIQKSNYLIDLQKSNTVDVATAERELLDKQAAEYKFLVSKKAALKQTAKAYGENTQEAAKVEEEIAEIEKRLEKLKKLGSGKDFLNFEAVDTSLEALQKSTNNIISSAQNIKSIGELIGDGYKVAAENVQTLRDLYPEMLNGAKVWADGSVTLTQQVVDQFVNGEKTKLQANAQQTIGELENRRTILESLAAYYSTQAELIQGGIANNKTAEEIQQELDANTARNAETLDNEYARDFAENLSKGTDAQAQAVNKEVDNLQILYNAAKATAAAMKAALTGGDVAEAFAGGFASGTTVTGGGDASNVGSTDNSGSSKTDAKYKDLQKQADEYKKMAVAAQKGAGDITAQIASIKNALNNAFNAKDVGKGGGSGGGGDAKQQVKDLLDLYEDARDVFHDINEELEDQDTLLKRISKNTDKLSGEKLVKNLKEQNKLYEKQNELLLKKKKLQLEEQDRQRKILEDLGATFDVAGDISNYMKLVGDKQDGLNKLIQDYNTLVESYNAANSEELEEQIDKMKDLVDAEQKALKDLTDKISQYDTLRNEIDATEDSISEKANSIIENQIQAFKVEVEVELKLGEAKRDWNKFQANVIDRVAESDFFGKAQAAINDLYSYYNDEENGTVQALTNQVEKTREELESLTSGGHSDIYSRYDEATGKWIDDYAKAEEDLQNYTQQLMQAVEDADAIATEVHENVMSQIDKESEAFEKQRKKYEHIGDLIEHDIKLIQLLYGESEQYEHLDNYYQQRADNAIAQIDFLKQERAEWQRLADAAKVQRDAEEEGSREWEEYNEEYEKFYDNFVDATSELNSSIENAVDNAYNKWTNAIQKIIKQVQNSVFGSDRAYQSSKDIWERTKWEDDRYLDRLDRAKELLSLESKINKTINDTTSANTQKKLAEFRDKELEDLMKKDKLSQADIDYANKKLEVIQKQMALEDAQNSKTQMRLRRDSQGNYTYQYVANADDVQSKLEEYQQALNDLREIPKEQIESTYDEIYGKIDEFYEKVAELAETYKDDQEAYAEKAKELYESYYGEKGYITQLVADANTLQQYYNEATFVQLDALQESEKEKFAAFLGITGEGADDDSLLGAIEALIGTDGKATNVLEVFTNDIAEKKWNQLRDHERDTLTKGDDSVESIWNTTLSEMTSKYQEVFIPAVMNGMDQILEANEQWKEDLSDIEDAADITFSEMAAGLDDNIQLTNELLSVNGDLIESYGRQTDAVRELADAYREAAQEARDYRQAAIDAAEDSYDALEDAWDYDEDEEEATGPARVNYSTATGPAAEIEARNAAAAAGASAGVKIAPNEAEAASIYSASDVEGIAGNIWLYESWGTGGRRKSLMEQKFGTAAGDALYSKIQQKFNSGYGYRGGLEHDKNYYRNYGPDAFYTGGYTGEWGEEGRLAVLHQKEYVLNAKDTPNVLNAVTLANKVMERVSNMNSRLLGNLLDSPIGNMIPTNNSDVIEQNVQINATFPDVSKAEEIERAFNNLVNMASQRASKSNR